MSRLTLCLSLLCSLALACSDDASQKTTNNDDGNCLTGERYNVITGKCEPRASSNNGGGDLGGDLGADQGGADMPVGTPDMMETPDFSIIPPEGCTPGDKLGCASDTAELVCDAAGVEYRPKECSGGQRCLNSACTSMICIPGTLSCANPESTQRCNAAGTGYEAPVACEEGSVCSQDSCKSVCELGKYRSSYIGCEYWSLDLDQHPDPTVNPRPNTIPHSVVISNPNMVPVTVSFTVQQPGISVMVPDPVVPAQSTRAFTMPQLDVDATSISRHSIRIVASQPVVAHQFNPLNNVGAYSNDGTLLLPAPMLGDDYYVVNWPTQYLPNIGGLNVPSQHSYAAILATEPGETFINVTSTAQIAGGTDADTGQAINPLPPGATRTFKLTYGQVLNLQAFEAKLAGGKNDLTGTHIKANKPVAVFAGHEAAVIGEPGNNPDGSERGSCCADHIEHQLLPLQSWDSTYIAALSPGRGVKKDHWRVVAGEDGITLTTDPPQPGANNVTLNKGQFVTFFSDKSFEIKATGKIQVAQFLVSQEQTSEGVGDPSLVISVPTARYRKDYVLLTPSGYTRNYVTVTRPAGAPIKLNGQLIPDATFSPVGSGVWEVGSVEVQPGVQSLDSTQAFGIAAYGFANAVSYSFIGGLDLVGSQAAP
jgi:hypothetical protein